MTAYYTEVSAAPLRTNSELFPAVAGWIAKVGQAVWRVLEASGQARARRDLIELANRYEALQPSFAQELRYAASRADRA